MATPPVSDEDVKRALAAYHREGDFSAGARRGLVSITLDREQGEVSRARIGV